MRSRSFLSAPSIALSLSLGLSLSLVGCAEVADEEGAHLVPRGKADNYYSDVAKEFELTGTVSVEIGAADYDDEVLRRDAISRRLTAVGLYLTGYLTDKLHGIDRNNDGEISDDEVFFRNDGWGDFQAMVRNYTIETEDVEAQGDDLFAVEFTIDVAGPKNLLSLIPRDESAEDLEDGAFVFSFEMPRGKTVDPESVPRGEFRTFDPRNYDGELETITFAARPQADIGDAYPHYRAFAEDGVYDITMFFGYDYNEARWDIREATETFDTLRQMGFALPVEQFEDLESDSGPFVRMGNFGGRNALIEVRLFHADMFEGKRQEQHDLAVTEVIDRDVFFYNGHAGPYYGFYLDEEKEATVNYWEFEDAPFDPGRQQLLIAQGCQTYSQYADMLYASPNRDEGNLDAITTVNYSYGQGTQELFRSLVRLDSDGNHDPVSYYEIVRELNSSWINSSKEVFYGVMGIDGNPQLHPYANRQSIGDACTSSSDCGSPEGNVCMELPNGVQACAALAVGDDCPEGSRYGELGIGNQITENVCYAAGPGR